MQPQPQQLPPVLQGGLAADDVVANDVPAAAATGVVKTLRKLPPSHGLFKEWDPCFSKKVQYSSSPPKKKTTVSSSPTTQELVKSASKDSSASSAVEDYYRLFNSRFGEDDEVEQGVEYGEDWNSFLQANTSEVQSQVQSQVQPKIQPEVILEQIAEILAVVDETNNDAILTQVRNYDTLAAMTRSLVEDLQRKGYSKTICLDSIIDQLEAVGRWDRKEDDDTPSDSESKSSDFV